MLSINSLRLFSLSLFFYCFSIFTSCLFSNVLDVATNVRFYLYIPYPHMHNRFRLIFSLSLSFSSFLFFCAMRLSPETWKIPHSFGWTDLNLLFILRASSWLKIIDHIWMVVTIQAKHTLNTTKNTYTEFHLIDWVYAINHPSLYWLYPLDRN